jgi:carboxymethylenebutenolidase
MNEEKQKGLSPAYLALPKNGRRGPGVVVLHSWWGLNEFFKKVCDRLAQEGFVAAAPDLYNGAVATTLEDAKKLSESLDREQALIKVVGTAEFLKTHASVQGSGMGAVGFSLGASWALRLSIVEPNDIAAVVVFYGTGDGNFSLAKAAYLGHFAPQDPWETDQDIQNLEDMLHSAGRETVFYTYLGTNHWFMEENRPKEYDPQAAGLAWQRTLDFLKKQLVES